VGWDDYRGNRSFSNASGQSGNAYANYGGNNYSASSTIGYDFNYQRWTINPFARVDYVHNTLNGYKEYGSAALAADMLNISKQEVDSMRLASGVEVDYAISTPWAVVIPTMRLEWQHEFMNDSRLITATSATTGQTALYTHTPDRDFLNLGVGFSTVMPNGFSGFFSYDTMQANSYTSMHSFTGGIRMEF
jgi:outer membrane autotransporter protein